MEKERDIRAFKPEDYWDTARFKQIVNREVWRHRLSDEGNRFRRSMGTLVDAYSPDLPLAVEICDLLLTEGEDTTLPGQVAFHWAELVRQTDVGESKDEFLALARDLKAKDVEVVGAFDLLYQVREDQERVRITADKVREYADGDVRQVEFTQKTLKPLLRRGLDTRDLAKVFSGLEQWYMIDRQLEESAGMDIVSDCIGSGASLDGTLPLPILAFAQHLGNPDLLDEAASHRDFTEGREVQRRIYHGLAALSERDDGSGIYTHLCQHLKRPKDIAKALGTIDVLRKDRGFDYDFTKSDPAQILRSLELRLVDENVRRIGLDDPHLEAFIDRSSDSDFRMIDRLSPHLQDTTRTTTAS